MHEVGGGRFDVIRLLGAGAAGSVYEALDRTAGERVALKILKSGVEATRFAREVAALSRIRSAHVVSLRDFGVDDVTKAPWTAMELLDGDDVAVHLEARGRLAPRVAARVIAQSCAGIAAAHAAGVVHRDLKPSNLYLANSAGGEIIAKVIDFGLAAQQGGEATKLGVTGVTRAGALLGTPRYLAPEQARGSVATDLRVDIFALGVVLYECLTGTSPYPPALPVGELLLRIASAPPRVLTGHDAFVPRELARIVDRALAFDREGRYPSARCMRDALVNWLGDERGLTAVDLAPRVRPADAALCSARPIASRRDLAPRSVFGAYEIVELLGRGGMGAVYRARDIRLNRIIALKVVDVAEDGSRRVSAGDTAVTRAGVPNLLREARVAAKIAHPNAVAVYDAGEVDASPFIVMEEIAGSTVRALMQRQVPIDERIQWVTAVARVLAAVHRIGVVHGDIKPENVMVRADDRAVKVLDFGIARTLVDDVAPCSAAASGTAAYMAPEQLRGARADRATDQFTWGVFAYELLCGTLPWSTSGGVADLFREILTRAPDPPAGRAVLIPRGVIAVVLRAMAKVPGERYATMDDVVEALQFVHSSTARRRVPRGRARTVIIGAVALTLGISSASVTLLAGDAAGPRAIAMASAPASATSPAIAATDVDGARSQSAEARDEYRAGMLAIRNAAGESARRDFDRATVLDPSFAAAHLRRVLATPYVTDDERAHLLKATQLRSELSEHDRALLNALSPWLDIPQDAAEGCATLGAARAQRSEY